jgi:hypothetical protein
MHVPRRNVGAAAAANERVGDRRLGFGRDLAVGRVRVPRLDAAGQDDVLAAPHRLEPGRLGTAADLERRVAVDADAGCEREAELHATTSADTQLPWNPNGMRGSATEATGDWSIVDAS